MSTEFHSVYIKPIYQISTFYLIVFLICITHSRMPQQKLIMTVVSDKAWASCSESLTLQ